MVVERVERGMREVRDDELMMILHNLEVGGGARCICQGCWGRFFWLVHPRRGDWGNLVIGVERPDADALVIWFVVGCGGDADDANGRGVGGVEGAGIIAVADADAVGCVGPFAGDGVNPEVGIAGGGGTRVGFDGDADGVVGAAVTVVVVDVFSVVVVVAVAAAAAVVMRGRQDVSDIGGDMAEVKAMP